MLVTMARRSITLVHDAKSAPYCQTHGTSVALGKLTKLGIALAHNAHLPT